jgi:hypothetical protein
MHRESLGLMVERHRRLKKVGSSIDNMEGNRAMGRLFGETPGIMKSERGIRK